MTLGLEETWNQAEESGLSGSVKLLKFIESGNGTKMKFGESKIISNMKNG